MITQVTSRGQTAVFSGLSTDIKPTSVPNASVFKELDTSTEYLFDGQSKQWLKQANSSGGDGGDSGGGGSDEMYICKVFMKYNDDDDPYLELSMTEQELRELINGESSNASNLYLDLSDYMPFLGLSDQSKSNSIYPIDYVFCNDDNETELMTIINCGYSQNNDGINCHVFDVIVKSVDGGNDTVENLSRNGTVSFEDESGGGGSSSGSGIFKIGYTDANAETLDKTWNEINNAARSGLLPVIVSENDSGISFMHVSAVFSTGNIFRVIAYAVGTTQPMPYNADNPNDYPKDSSG